MGDLARQTATSHGSARGRIVAAWQGGPIGFALDVLSAWHTELLRSLQFLARIKAEVISPSSQGPQWALGVEDATS